MTELRIGPASAGLRATLRPIEWMVLEEVALAAGAAETGVLVAPTSGRAVAERLGLTAGAVARAMASLRAVGLVSHVRHSDPSGRFGPSSYMLGSIPGLEVVGPGPAPWDPAPLRVAILHVREHHVWSHHTWWRHPWRTSPHPIRPVSPIAGFAEAPHPRWRPPR